MLMTRSISITIVLLLFAIGCTKPIEPSTETALLPTDWPLEAITLPAGSTVAAIPGRQNESVTSNVQVTGPGGQGRSWSVGFSTDLSIDELYKHVESCISDSGTSFDLRDDSSFTNPISGDRTYSRLYRVPSLNMTFAVGGHASRKLKNGALLHQYYRVTVW